MKYLELSRQIKTRLSYVLNIKQKRNAIFILCAIIIGAFFELLGVSAIVPFLYAMLSVDELQKNEIIAAFIQFFDIKDTSMILMLLGLAMIVLYIVKNGYMILLSYLKNKYCLRLQRDLSVLMLKSYMIRPYSFFRKMNSAEMLIGVQGDVTGAYQVINSLLELCTQIILSSLVIIYLFVTDLFMALGISIIAISCLLLIVLGLNRKMKVLGQELRHAQFLTNKYVSEIADGIKEITVLKRREHFVNKYITAADLREKNSLWKIFSSECPDRLIEGACVSGFVGIVCIKIYNGADIAMFIPALGAFALGAFKILPSISKISNHINNIVYFFPSLDAMYDNLKKSNESIRLGNIYEECEGLSYQRETFESTINIENIYWKYEDGIEYILDDLSLEIKKGEMIGLIGASGAGKSTLVDTILGLFLPEKGKIKIDNKEIEFFKYQYSNDVGYVPQTVFLLDDTIRRNVAFGVNDENISDERVWAVLEQAQIKSFVESLPLKLDTIVGEQGIRFSGGQRQRIAIARALYNNPQIIILDEATSALDTETENALVDAINALHGEKTLIVVAHRLTTIRNCDKIYEISGGKAILRNKEEVIRD